MILVIHHNEIIAFKSTFSDMVYLFYEAFKNYFYITIK